MKRFTLSRFSRIEVTSQPPDVPGPGDGLRYQPVLLYPQDLAFISSVKPSQKRKVEVK